MSVGMGKLALFYGMSYVALARSALDMFLHPALCIGENQKFPGYIFSLVYFGFEDDNAI